MKIRVFYFCFIFFLSGKFYCQNPDSVKKLLYGTWQFNDDGFECDENTFPKNYLSLLIQFKDDMTFVDYYPCNYEKQTGNWNYKNETLYMYNFNPLRQSKNDTIMYDVSFNENAKMAVLGLRIKNYSVGRVFLKSKK